MISRRGQIPFEKNLNTMTKSPIIAIVLEWVEIIEYVRKMVWSTEPKTASPGTIRWDYAHMSFWYADEADIGLPNLIHASGDLEEAKKEIKHRFSDNELFDYKPLHCEFTR
jgi:nucleoside-diphosphate kinase